MQPSKEPYLAREPWVSDPCPSLFESSEGDEILSNEPTDAENSKDMFHVYRNSPMRPNRRTANFNILTANPGLPQSVNSLVTTPFESLKLFLTHDLVTHIVRCTDEKINFSFGFSDFWLWIGANLFMGLSNSKNASVEEMYDQKYGFN